MAVNAAGSNALAPMAKFARHCAMTGRLKSATVATPGAGPACPAPWTPPPPLLPSDALLLDVARASGATTGNSDAEAAEERSTERR